MKMDKLQGTNLYWYLKDTQVEGIDFEETFSPVSRMETIQLILAYACSKNIKVYQMDVKSTFLNGELEEEVYIEKPKGFQLS
jgi:hypothetical protein